jgi:hypothetical protein
MANYSQSQKQRYRLTLKKQTKTYQMYSMKLIRYKSI